MCVMPNEYHNTMSLFSMFSLLEIYYGNPCSAGAVVSMSKFYNNSVVGMKFLSSPRMRWRERRGLKVFSRVEWRLLSNWEKQATLKVLCN